MVKSDGASGFAVLFWVVLLYCHLKHIQSAGFYVEKTEMVG